jgi:hypothetical protein
MSRITTAVAFVQFFLENQYKNTTLQFFAKISYWLLKAKKNTMRTRNITTNPITATAHLDDLAPNQEVRKEEKRRRKEKRSREEKRRREEGKKREEGREGGKEREREK